MKTDNPKKFKIHHQLSIVTTLIGILLMSFMVIVEDEPGALPLALIIIGTGWYFFTRSKLRAQQT